MPLPPHDQRTIDNFFSTIEPFMASYSDSTFTYVAVKSDDKFILMQSFIHLVASAKPSFSQFASKNIRAGRYRLANLAKDLRTFIESLLVGKLATPEGDLYFPADHNGNHSVWMQLFHPAGLQNQSRTTVLKIMGSDKYRYMQQPQLDWELKAHACPYDGLQELMNEYGLGLLQQDKVSLEIVASHVAAVDFGSPVNGTKATLQVLLANGLAPEKVTVGVRTFCQGKVVDRSRKEGSDFQWNTGAEIQKGSLAIDIPEGAVLHCIASYAGIAQHFGWLVDPSTMVNSRRAAYETFDPKLEHLQEVFSRTSFRGRDARELESAVSWLLWILGLSVAHLGSVPKMQDAIDLFVTAPSGHIAVVEVTTGILKAENKLALLYDRAQSVRRNVEASGNRHIRVLPVIVTSQPRADVEVDIEQAEKMGILVVTHESLAEALKQTASPQNPDKLFEDAEQQVRLALAKHQNQPLLPFEGSNP